jgi:hypothetical protein
MMQVCEDCIELDQNKVTRVCERCATRFCIHNASDIDIRYCHKCMVDVTMTVRELEARKSKEIVLSGSDLYFAEKAIHNTPDEVLELKIEYYGRILSGLLMERQERRIKRQDALAKVKLNFVKPASETKATKKKAAIPKAANPLETITIAMTAILGRKPTELELAAFVLKAGGLSK